MDYEKAYKAVLKTATQWIKDGCTDKEKICLECVFPELRESEDERIRKVIYKLMLGMREEIFTSQDEIVTKEKVLAYLEKQKEIDSTPLDWNDYKDKPVEVWNAYISGKAVGIEIEKQKKLFESGKGLYYYDGEKATYCGYPATEENPYDFAISQQEKQKEQKPISQEDFDTAKHEALWEEQKPAECIEDSVKFEEGFKAGRESGLRDGQKYVLNNLDSYGLCKSAEWSEEDEDYMNAIIMIINRETALYPKGGATEDLNNDLIAWLKSLRPDTFQNGNSRPKTSDNWKPSEEKKKETLDGADIGYGLETAIDILENGFTHYQTDDGEYERKQALDVLIFLLNETRKKEDAKLWSKDIVESIVTWATEKLQLYSMKESTPYVEAVKNNAQKVLDWAKEQWPIYYGWKPSEEQMTMLRAIINDPNNAGAESCHLAMKSLYEQLEKM